MGNHDFGFPHTLEEVKAELREADAVWDDATQWSTSEDMWAEIKQTFPWANLVKIITIWDMRNNPDKLRKSIR